MSKYHSDRLQRKKRKIFLVKVAFFSVLFLILFFSFAGISRIDYLNIQEIKISGNKAVTEKDLLDITNKQIKGNYWFLFSKKNILIYPKEDIKENILAKYPIISNVDIKLTLPNSLNIKVKEREPYVLWCDNTFVPTEEIKQNCFFADNNGYIFEKAPDFSDKTIFEYYSYLKQKNPLRSSIFTEAKFKNIDSFRQFLDGLGLSPYKLLVKDNKSCEIYFGEGGKIIFDLDQNIVSVMNNLQSILNTKDFEDKNFLWSLEYIDLRFGNKVFYR